MEIVGGFDQIKAQLGSSTSQQRRAPSGSGTSGGTSGSGSGSGGTSGGTSGGGTRKPPPPVAK